MMVPDLVSQLTNMISPTVILGVIVLLAVLDLFDIFSDSGRKFDLLIRTIVVVAAGYLVISGGGIF